MSALEERYRSLLRAYPASYRADRSGEMLDTLLEASRPGQSRPAARDVRALILGGLRARAGLGPRESLGDSLRQVVLFAAVLKLVTWSTFDAIGGVSELISGPTHRGAWFFFALAVGVLTAAAGAWFWRRSVVIAIAMTTAALTIVVYTGLAGRQLAGGFWLTASEPLLALAVIAVWARKRERLPWFWLYLAVLRLACVLLPAVWPVPRFFVGEYLTIYGSLILLAIALAWSIVDARLLAATALWLAADYSLNAIQFTASVVSVSLWFVWLPVIIALTATATGTWLIRRQAVL